MARSESSSNLRRGYTTGTCATAACRAAALYLTTGECPASVDIELPCGDLVTLPTHAVACDGTMAEAFVIKDAGDDPDVTHGAEIHATVDGSDKEGIAFLPGEGVGMVTRDGLQIAKGEPAINPVPRQMIAQALAGIPSPLSGWTVSISVPTGRKLAEKTYNPRLGIEGGISIIGTSGYVLPRSHKGLRGSLLPFLNLAKAAGLEEIIFVPGNVGRRAAESLFPDADEKQIIETSDWLGYMLQMAAKEGFGKIHLVGHPGKFGKVLNGDWQTHSSRSGPANEAVISFWEGKGLDKKQADEFRKLPMTEAMQLRLLESGKRDLLDELAGEIRRICARYINYPVDKLTVTLCDMEGRLTTGEKGSL